MKIPFTKAHGARNDFLLTWRDDLPENADLAALAIAICDRHTGSRRGRLALIVPGSHRSGRVHPPVEFRRQPQ